MITKIANAFRPFFQGDTRSVLIKKNILGSFFIKGWSGVIQLLLVPLTLDCLNTYEYGIWLTINSILIWMDSFDIGLGNGLRNKLAEAIALKDYSRARSAVSTTFVMLILVIIPIMLLVFVLINSLDLYAILNVEPSRVRDLPGILMASFSIVGATFIFKFIGNVYLALQLPAINNLLVVGGQTLALLGIIALSLIGKGTLQNVAIIYTVSPLIVYLIAYPFTFYRQYTYLAPSLKCFEKSMMSDLFSLGLKFFVLQIAGVILFASSNLLISNLFGPEDVIPYQISYRYFSFAIMLFTVIITPLWSAVTDAYAKNELGWIKNSMKKMNKTLVFFIVILSLMFVFSPFVYEVWIRNKVDVPVYYSLIMAVYCFILMYSLCYSQFLFGIGRIQLPVIVTLIEAIVYIPLAVGLSRVMGVYGVILALLIVNLFCAITNKIQFEKIISGKAKGIWMK